MKDRDTKIHLAGSAGAGEVAETAPEAGSEPSEAGKLATELDHLRQTLLRRQADFDNYRKRTEKERLDDNKRATSRVIEALIPILDSFEQALAAHREAEYES